MAGTDSPDIGAPHPSAPVRPPRRVLPPDPATAPDDGGWTRLASFRDPAERHRRLERTLWLLVAAVTVAGVVVIGAILTSGPSSEAILPPGSGGRVGGSLSDGDTSSLAAAPGGADGEPSSDGLSGDDGADARGSNGDDSGSAGNGGSSGDGSGSGGSGGGSGSGSVTGDGVGTGDGATNDHASPLPADDDDAPSSDGDVPANTGDAPPNDDGAPPGNGDASMSDDLAANDGGPPPGWSEVARGFGLAFTRTGVGRDAWFATMSSWLTPEQAAEYRDVPIEAIPTGNLVRVDVADPAPAEHALGTLTYDTGMVLAVGLSYRADAGSWLVARVELADVAEEG